MEEEEASAGAVAADAGAAGESVAPQGPGGGVWAQGPGAGDEELERRFIANRRTAQLAEALSMVTASQLPVDTRRAQRAQFAEGNFPDPETGLRVGLAYRAGRVMEARVDGVPTFILCVDGRSESFAVRETIREALYGEVARANLIRPAEGGGYRSAVQEGGLRTVDFAIKRVCLNNMESQTSARGDLMQEDPIKEIAVQQLLSYPAHPSLGTPEFVLRDALNLYIVMPFRGVESYQVLTEPTYTPASHFSEPVARHCFRQLIGALSHMHAHGVAHLDVSLENVLIDMETMHCTLIDFGLAKYFEPPIADGRSLDRGFDARALQPTNKFYYIAPEIFASEPFHGVLVDLWAAGAVLFIMLTGVPLLEAANRTCKRFRVLKRHGPRVLLERMRARTLVSESGCDLLARMFELEPQHRLKLAEVLEHPWMREEA